jgi:transposase-like protein
MIVALGIDIDGRKTVMGLRKRATENNAVVSELLGDLTPRAGLQRAPAVCARRRKGANDSSAASCRPGGDDQRCPIHKRRNVIDHLPEEHQSAVKKKLQNAYAMTEYVDGKRALNRLHRILMELNPSAATSLEEGMVETLTVHRSNFRRLLGKVSARVALHTNILI